MNKEQKAQQVEEIAAALQESTAVFAVDYRGISVPQAAELRGKLSDADATFKVVKNRLAKRAIEGTKVDGLTELLDGPTALTLIKGDPVVAAKAIATFAREHDVLVFKGGIMDGKPLEQDEFVAIARLPAVEVLHGQLVGLVASPITGLAAGMNNLISGLGRQLAQMADQGLVTGDPPATEEPAAEAEAPAEAETPADVEEGTEEEAPATDEEAPAEDESADPAAEGESAGASDEVAEEEAEPAAPSEPEPDGTGGEAEDSGGVIQEEPQTSEETEDESPEASASKGAETEEEK